MGQTFIFLKMDKLFDDPDTGLYSTSYTALPFWIFFEVRHMNDHFAPLTFLKKYELTGNEELTLEDSIDELWPKDNVYGKLDTFFALFARDRAMNLWNFGPFGHYRSIVDANVNETFCVSGRKNGGNYSIKASVFKLIMVKPVHPKIIYPILIRK